MSEKPSKLARWLARLMLCSGRYPGRRLVGALYQGEARRRGGRGFTVSADDGVVLDAWFSPAAHGATKHLPVVFMHGWLEVKELYLPRAYRLNERGHDVVLFDQRAHGRSGGKASTFSVREKHDAAAVIDAAAALHLIGERVITLGHSMGAATALQHAAMDRRVAGVVAFAPFVSFRAAIESFRAVWAPWMRPGWAQGGFDWAAQRYGFTIDDADTLEAMSQLAAPVLLIEGGQDANLPPRDHVQPLVEAKANGQLDIFTVDAANHYSLPRRDWPGLDDVLEAFCAALH